MKGVKLISPHIHYTLSPHFFHTIFSIKWILLFFGERAPSFFIKVKLKWKNKIMESSGCIFSCIEKNFFLAVILFDFERGKKRVIVLAQKKEWTSIKFVWLSE